MNYIPFTKLLDTETLSLRTILRDRNVKIYKRSCTLYKGLACKKASEYLLRRDEFAPASDYLQQAWEEFSDFGSIDKLSQMVRKYSESCSFKRNLCCQEGLPIR